MPFTGIRRLAMARIHASRVRASISVMDVDAAGVTITKALSIIAADGVDAAIGVTTGHTGIRINGSGSIVLRGLHVNGQMAASATAGIDVKNSRASVTINHVTVSTTYYNIEAGYGFALIEHSLLTAAEVGIFRDYANVYIGEDTISGNVYGFTCTLISSGDDNINGNTTCDTCDGGLNQVSRE